MKNLLVFLHGKGRNSVDSNKADFIEDVAQKYNADILYIKAPIGYEKDKHCWYNKKKGSQDAVEQNVSDSIDYVKTRVEKELEGRSASWDSVILLGYSQGGCIAIETGLLNTAKAVIAICPCLPYNIDYTNISNNKMTPVYWFEGSEDTYISKERKESHSLLTEQRINLKYTLKKGLSHNGFGVSITNDID